MLSWCRTTPGRGLLAIALRDREGKAGTAALFSTRAHPAIEFEGYSPGPGVELRVSGIEWQKKGVGYCAALSACAQPYGIANYALLAVADGPAKRPLGDAPLNLRVHPMYFSHENGQDI
jgi:hypothetical protein